MAVQFVLGRSGTGKTSYFIDAIVNALGEPSEQQLILLVPEQITAYMERRLATWPGMAGGYTRARVFSFKHLSREALTRAGEGLAD